MSPGKRERSQARFQRWRCDFLGILGSKGMSRARAKAAINHKIGPLTFHQFINNNCYVDEWKAFLNEKRAGRPVKADWALPQEKVGSYVKLNLVPKVC